MIREETILSKDIDIIEYKEKLDELCKKILSNRMILAWIMKTCMKEFKNYEILDIANNYIEGIPEVSKVVLHRDEKYNSQNKSQRRIVGQNTEDSSVTEGKVTFDIRFVTIIPVTEECIKLIINIEAQDDFYPGYPLIKRGFYYGCRLISSQYGTEFVNSHYEGIKKIYSIWICTNPPECRKNTITGYSMSESNIVGDVKEKEANYDLLNLIMICLGDLKGTNKNGNKLLKLLNVLFSKELSVEEKKKTLEIEFNMQMTVEMESEVQNMCNYSDGIVRRGFELGMKEGMDKGMDRGIFKAISNLMENMSITSTQAMDMLLIPDSDREKYTKMME